MLGLKTSKHRLQRANAPKIALAHPSPHAASQHDLEASRPPTQAVEYPAKRLIVLRHQQRRRRSLLLEMLKSSGHGCSNALIPCQATHQFQSGSIHSPGPLNQSCDDLAAPIAIGH